jgi:hypothetical protein
MPFLNGSLGGGGGGGGCSVGGGGSEGDLSDDIFSLTLARIDAIIALPPCTGSRR